MELNCQAEVKMNSWTGEKQNLDTIMIMALMKEKKKKRSKWSHKKRKKKIRKHKKDESGLGIAKRSGPIFLSLRDIGEFLFYLLLLLYY